MFFLDIGKQAIVTTFTHFINVFLSVFLQTKTISAAGKADQCAWYFTTFLLDLFPGMLIVFVLNYFIEAFLQSRNLKKFISGNYAINGKEHFQIDVEGYFAETFVWLCIQMIAKFALLIVYALFLEGLSTLGYYMLKALDFSKNFKLTFVMVIFPILVDVVCFSIGDSLLQKHNWEADEVGLMSSYYDDLNNQVIEMETAATSLYVPQLVSRASLHAPPGEEKLASKIWISERPSRLQIKDI